MEAMKRIFLYLFDIYLYLKIYCFKLIIVLSDYIYLILIYCNFTIYFKIRNSNINITLSFIITKIKNLEKILFNYQKMI